MQERGVREIRLGVYATEEEIDDIKERIIRLLCPDPDHAPPCPVPWSIAVLSEESLDAGSYDELTVQFQAEHPSSS